MSRVVKQAKQKTILGYHDKRVNKFGVMGTKQLPILTSEDYSTFLVTRDHNFVVETKQIEILLNNYMVTARFRKLKKQLATILILPGILISIGFVLKLLGFFYDYPTLHSILSSRLVNWAFWISVLGVIISWHDYFRLKSHPIKLPETPPIPEKQAKAIKTAGFKFARYIQLKAFYFLSEESQRLLAKYYRRGIFDTLEFFAEILTAKDTQRILERANLEIDVHEFETKSINSTTIPDYPTAGLRCIILYALEDAILTESHEIRPEHFFSAFFKVFPTLKNLLNENNSSVDLIREIIRFFNREEEKEKASNILNPDTIYYRTGGVGKFWIYGYTFILNKFSKDITEKVASIHDRFGIGHEREIEEITSILGRMSNKNVLLIGEPGVGKSSIIKGLAQSILAGQVPPHLKNKRIIQLDVTGLLARGVGEGNLEQLIQKAMQELSSAGNTILYIDEIQEIIPAKSDQSGTSISSIMLPYILESNFPIIGTINYADYKKFFYSNESLRQSFDSVEVSPVFPTDALEILETIIDDLEQNYDMYITFPALTAAVELSQRYISERKLPDSAVRTLEATCSWAQSKGIRLLDDEHVAKYISIQTEIPVDSINAEEATKLMNLEQNIKKRVIGQDEAVNKTVESLKRARTDIRDPNKPIGVFLFLGPTGVGKTHLAKVIAQEYFGREDGKEDIIKIDMSEYQDTDSINKFLGSYERDSMGQSSVTLLDKVKSRPYSVVLFDEIEKAHARVLDLFLQLFDEGRLTSNRGETINFTNCIIICTSNIGSKLLLDALNDEKALWEEAKNRAIIELRQAIRPELLNRFDDVIVFSPHTVENLVKITEILLTELADRISEKGISITWGKPIPVLIANKARVPGMGARPLKRYIQEKVEGRLATEIIQGSLQKGSEIEIKSEWLN
ncbi:AAA domain-containing protein [Candidatus Dojkabacteria bacterium]|nr:AAA domain-containing protein [Candidatus Dojkabacteria bacterium]